jgi:lysophospholipid acyltransferase (LPLAT)-like uncharacterized protein
MFKTKILPFIIYVFYKIYFFTVRQKIEKVPIPEPFIVAHFHQDELCLINTRKKRSYLVMTSKSKDGEMMTKFLNLLGYKCVRGSSSKAGGTALHAMIKKIKKEGLSSVVAVDGPRGPIYKVKKGIIKLAYETGLPILPIRVIAKNAFIFKKSWNKAILAKPFSTFKVKIGKPIYVKKESEEKRKELEKSLINLKENE